MIDFLIKLGDSAVTVALVTGIMTLIMKRMERKWSKEDKSSEIQQSINKLSYEFHEDQAKRYRNEMLRFGDEIRMGWKHSRESYENFFDCAKNYNSFCELHPDFRNDMTMIAQEITREDYKKRIENNDFA